MHHISRIGSGTCIDFSKFILISLSFACFDLSKISNSSRITTRSRDLTLLMTSADPNNMATNNVAFMKRCKRLKAHQQIQISQALCCLGHTMSLSEKWLNEAIGTLKDIGMPDAVSAAADVATRILYLLRKWTEEQENNAKIHDSNNWDIEVANPLSLYESGSATFTEGYDEKLRLTAHTGMAFLQKGLHIDASSTLDGLINGIRDLADPPSYHQELQDAIDALVIINVKQDEMDKAEDLLKLRLELASRWEGDNSIKRAKELRRLVCFYSVIGENAECTKQLDESLSILLSDNDNPNVNMEMILDSAKLLATSYDAMEQNENAVHQYEFAIDKETDSIKKAKLMNAISHRYCRSGKSNHAFEYLDKSLALQKSKANKNDENTSLLTDTMILYGNAMASKQSYSEACFWYDSALNANTDKSPLHPDNLRAWYNKGVALFHSEDVIGAGHALGIIVDAARKNPEARTRGVSFVLNGIGNIHYVNKRYENAIELYKESLSTGTEDFFTPCQRAGTWCNIATAEYKMGDFKGAKISFEHALKIAHSMGDSSWEAKSIIFSKAAYVCYKRKAYNHAFLKYSEGKR